MTIKRDSKRKPKKAEQPKVKKEVLKDLNPKHAEQLRGGTPRPTEFVQCTS